MELGKDELVIIIINQPIEDKPAQSCCCYSYSAFSAD